MSLPQLSVTLAAKTADFERGIMKASELALKQLATMEARGQLASTRLGDVFSKIGGLGNAQAIVTGVAGAIAGFKAIEFTISAMSNAAEEARKQVEALVKIGTGAASAGVGTTFFQSWTAQAKALHMEASSLESMLQNALSASTTSIGEGKAKSTSPMGSRIEQDVLAGNLTRADAATYQAAATQEAKIRSVLALIEQLQQKGMNLAALDLAGKMFGSDFEAKLRAGVDMIGKMRQALDGLTSAGGERIIPPEEIARAQELDRRIQEINNKFAEGLRPIREDIARWSQEELTSWTDMKDQLAGMVLEAGKLYSWFRGVADEFSKLGNADVFKNIAGWMDSHGLIDHDLQKSIEGEHRPAEAPRPLTISRDKSHALASISTGSSAGEDTRATETFVASLEKAAAALKAETDAYRKSNVEKQVSVNLAKAEATAKENGLTLTADEISRIKASSAAIGGLQDKLKDLNAEKQRMSELKDFAGNGLIDLFKGAQTGADGFRSALTRLVGSLEDLILKALILGQGPLAGLLGTASAAGSTGGLIGGAAKLLGFADGGEIRGPGDGTSDSILARVSHGEFIVSAAQARKFLPLLHALNSGKLPAFASGGVVGGASSPGGMMGGGQNINFAPVITSHVHANGGTDQENRNLSDQVARSLEAQMRSLVVKELLQQRRPGNVLGG